MQSRRAISKVMRFENAIYRAFTVCTFNIKKKTNKIAFYCYIFINITYCVLNGK